MSSFALGAMRKFCAFAVIFFLLCLAIPGVHLVKNWGEILGKNAYSVPKQSSVFFFSCTSISGGSGQYCEFGEDRNAFYGMCGEHENREKPKCHGDFEEFPKVQAATCVGFSPHDARTWCRTLPKT